MATAGSLPPSQEARAHHAATLDVVVLFALTAKWGEARAAY